MNNSHGCKRCRQLETRLGRCALVTAEAEFKAAREHRWWLGTTLLAVSLFLWVVFLTRSSELRDYVWINWVTTSPQSPAEAGKMAQPQETTQPTPLQDGAKRRGRRRRD